MVEFSCFVLIIASICHIRNNGITTFKDSPSRNRCTCHIKFDKPMHLTRTGEDIVDSTSSTYLFVKYNGQWCLVDMVADTEN